ncbi:MAG: HIT domain-containing protein [Halioglobus sp.]|nr:HIT domain-containing protein [Halioglobus sp.]
MNADEIDARLLADCHNLGSLPTSQLLLNRNAAVPWFILVPDTRLLDLLDLPQDHREAVLADCAQVSAFIKQALGYDKTNFAGLGNVVPQMHLHLIGRREGDACWPRPVWGNLPEGEVYTEAQLRELQEELVKIAALEPAPL